MQQKREPSYGMSLVYKVVITDEALSDLRRRINFLHHNYFLLYQLEGETAYVTNIFHGLEDADNKLR